MMGPESDKFCSITGATDVVAAQYLTACNNNLEMALNMYMETGPAPSSPGGAGNGGVGSGLDSGFDSTSKEAAQPPLRAPMPQMVAQLTPNAGAVFGQSSADRLPVVQPFADHRAAMMDAVASGGRGESGRPGKRSLHELYRPPMGLLHAGSLESAMRHACAAGKWLVVDLQDASEFGCQLLNRDIWSEPAVQAVLEASCVFLQLDSRSPAGCRFAANYRVPAGSPHVAVLDPVTGEQRVQFAPGQLRHVECFLERLTEFLSEHERPDAESGAGAPPEAMEAETDADTAASAPAAKRARRQPHRPQRRPSAEAAAGENGDADEDDAATGREQTEAAEAAEQLRRAVAASRLEDPGTDKHRRWLGDPAETDRCRLLVRYPDGRRRSLDWPASSRLRALTALLAEEGYPGEEFELLATHPRRLLTAEHAAASLRELGLCPSDTVYVQSK